MKPRNIPHFSYSYILFYLSLLLAAVLAYPSPSQAVISEEEAQECADTARLIKGECENLGALCRDGCSWIQISCSASCRNDERACVDGVLDLYRICIRMAVRAYAQ